MTLTRRDVWKLAAPWDPITKAYALAVIEMQKRPATDLTSWAYQAAVHGVGSVTAPPPDKFRDQCQHNSSFFLPWHRWYLYEFEQIVRATIASIAEVPADVKATWALPYWDYSRTGASQLPPAFRETKLWDGVRDNPLRVKGRSPGLNEGTARISASIASPLPGVLDQSFSSTFATPTFGGSEFIGRHHFHEKWANPGGLESTPHNNVHGAVGGLMLDFSTAALDPIFWLHHCNIDRWWEVRGHTAPHTDPTGAWATFLFDFHDGTGAPVRVKAGDSVATEAKLGYKYESITRPGGPPRPPSRRRQGIDVEAAPGAPAGPELPPEIVGHSDDGLSLTGAPASLGFAVGAPTNQFRAARPFAAAEDDHEVHRVILNVEDIRGAQNPGTSYEVYLGEQTPQHLAGVLSFFGIEMTQPDAADPHGLRYVFDITDVVDHLRDEQAWDPTDIQVSFKPVGLDYDDEPPSAGEPQPEVTIGRVSISYQ